MKKIKANTRTKNVSRPCYIKFPIPPKSIVKLAKLWPAAVKQGHCVGEIRRIGYYSKNDGLDCIWLVDANGRYNWTTDHRWLLKHFEIIKVSKERDYFGENKLRLRKIQDAKYSRFQSRKSFLAKKHKI